jgi:hypothetical protein
MIVVYMNLYEIYLSNYELSDPFGQLLAFPFVNFAAAHCCCCNGSSSNINQIFFNAEIVNNSLNSLGTELEPSSV